MARFERSLYPANWEQIAAQAKQAAGWQCQHCGRRHGEWTLNRYGEDVRVVVSVAHPDHDVRNPEARLAVWCLACHCRYDLKQRARQRRMMAMARGQLALF